VPPDANVLIAPAANPTEKIIIRYIMSSEQFQWAAENALYIFFLS